MFDPESDEVAPFLRKGPNRLCVPLFDYWGARLRQRRDGVWPDREMGMRGHGTSPCKQISRYRELRHERRLADAERQCAFNPLASTVEKDECFRHASAAIALVLLSCAHPAEILTLPWEHVDVERGVPNILDSRTGE